MSKTKETQFNTNLLPWDMASFIEYLQEIGYQITGEDLVTFYKVTGLVDLKNTNSLLDIENILRPLFVRNKTEDEHFHEHLCTYVKEYDPVAKEQKKKQRQKEYEEDERRYNNGIKTLELQIKNHEKRIREIDKEKKKEGFLKEKDLNSLKKQFEKVEKEYKSLLKKLNKEPAELLKNFQKVMEGKMPLYTKKEVQIMESALKELLMKAVTSENFAGLMDYIKRQTEIIMDIKQALNNHEKSEQELLHEKILKLNKEKENYQEQINNAFKQMEKDIASMDVVKKDTMNHRQEFIQGKNAVKSLGNAEFAVVDKTFKKLSEKEKSQLLQYIRENAKRFRTRMNRNIRTCNRKKLDIEETCKKACGTNGIPLRLSYEKPTRQKTKLVMFLDVSGSCREASELMMNFMYTMKEVFPGGCSTYAFTNKLYDVSEFMEFPDSEQATKAALNAIPRTGAYSDYYTPLRTFYEEHMNEITKDSMVFFIGDARNNKNQSGEEYIKEICRRARSAYWMNTETMDRWATGDSIIDIYAPYMKNIGQVTKTGELLEFLMGVR